MHLFEVSFYLAGAYYALFHNQQLLLPFFITIGAYLLMSWLIPGAKDISTRKKLMLATWTDPQVGNPVVRMDRRVDKVLNLIKRYPKEKQPSLAHFVVKAVGQMVKVQPDLNGSLSLGKYNPYETVDISYLTSVNQGKDLVKVLIKEADKKSIQQIRDIINEQLEAIRSGSRSPFIIQGTWLRFLPATLFGFFLTILHFFHNKIGVEISLLGVKHSFGAVIVVDVSNINLEDTYLSLIDCVNTSGVVTVCAPITAPVVEGDTVVIGNTMQVNFVMDHRWIDGGRCKQLFPTFNKTFEEPELYVDSFKPGQN